MRFVSLFLGMVLAAGAASAQTPAQQGPSPRGKQVYKQLCVACHGPYGRGDGPVSGDLSVKPPDFTRPEVLAGRTDEQVVADLMQAEKTRPHSPMLVTRVLKPETLREGVSYMRTLAVPGKHVSVMAGKDIFDTFCWLCHGVNGDGRGPAADKLGDVKPRDFTSPKFVVAGREAELERTITEGASASFHGSKFMEEWGTKLTPQQVKDVIAYIATFRAHSRCTGRPEPVSGGVGVPRHQDRVLDAAAQHLVHAREPEGEIARHDDRAARGRLEGDCHSGHLAQAPAGQGSRIRAAQVGPGREVRTDRVVAAQELVNAGESGVGERAREGDLDQAPRDVHLEARRQAGSHVGFLRPQTADGWRARARAGPVRSSGP